MKQFAILIISSFLLTGNILSQVWYNAEPDEHRLVYWFHVRVKIIEDDSTGYVSYVITEVQNKFSHGNLIEYQTDLFKSLKNNILPIGPFYDFHEAWKSKIIYEHAVLDSITDYYDDSFISKDSTFDAEDHRSMNLSPDKLKIYLHQLEKMQPLYDKYPGQTKAQLALRYCITHPACHVAIPGAKTEKQVLDNIKASDLGALPEEDQNPDPWEDPDESIKDRIYYLQLKT